MKKKIIDTGFTVGVSPTVQYFAEKELINEMNNNSIDIQIIYQPDECFFHETPSWNRWLGNDYISKIQKIDKTRIWGLATINVWHQPYPENNKISRNIAIEEIERVILDLDLNGVRMNPIQHNFAFNDRDVAWPLFEKLTQLQNKKNKRLMVSVHAYGDSLYNSPEAIADTAVHFPDLIFLMQHAGFVWGGFTVNDVSGPVENILFDLTTMPQYMILYKTYKILGAKKFCIGTDGPFSTNQIKTAILKDFAQNEEEEKLILGENILSLLDK